MFVEKYYSCYRDGTDGGKDMRSLASMYFLLRLLTDLVIAANDTFFNTGHTFNVVAVLFAGCSLMIALVRPYKKAYMNIIDALILGIMALIALTLANYFVQESSDLLDLFYALVTCIFVFIPLLGLTGFIAYKILKHLLKRLIKNFKTFNSRLLCLSNTSDHNESTVANEFAHQENSSGGSSDTELLDALHPKQYDGEMANYTSADYIQHEDIPNQKLEV